MPFPLEESPLFGRGLLTASRYEVLAKLGSIYTSSIHGTWVEALVGTGLVGVAFLASSFLVTGSRAFFATKRPGGRVVPLLLVVILLVRSVTGPTFEVAGGDSLMLMALMLLLRDPSRRPLVEQSKRKVGHRGLNVVRILILHSRYLSGPASGENAVVRDEAKLLSDGGHQVEVWEPSPDGVSGMDLLKTGFQAVWSRKSIDRVSRMIGDMRAEIVHCHNLFPTLSPAVISAAAGRGAAPIMTLHNYRLMCPPSTFLRDGRICEDCLGRAPWPGVVHRCYRDSLPGSAALALSLSTHRTLGTFDRVALFLCVSELYGASTRRLASPIEGSS